MTAALSFSKSKYSYSNPWSYDLHCNDKTHRSVFPKALHFILIWVWCYSVIQRCWEASGGRQGIMQHCLWRPADSSKHLSTSHLMGGPSLFLHWRLPYCHTMQYQNLLSWVPKLQITILPNVTALRNNFIHMFSLSWPSQMFTRGWKPLPGSTQVERIDNTYNNFQGISNDWLLYRFDCTDLPRSTSW